MTFRKVAVCDRCAKEAPTPEPHQEEGPEGWTRILVPLAFVADVNGRRPAAGDAVCRYVLDLCPRCAVTFGAFLTRGKR